MEGYFPENEVDHINRIKDDNKWKNLREVSHQCNIRNSGLRSTNRTGVTGVNLENKKWRSHIMVSGKHIYLGIFKDFVSAVRARWNAEKKYNYPNCNTKSVAYLYLKNNGAI